MSRWLAVGTLCNVDVPNAGWEGGRLIVCVSSESRPSDEGVMWLLGVVRCRDDDDMMMIRDDDR